MRLKSHTFALLYGNRVEIRYSWRPDTPVFRQPKVDYDSISSSSTSKEVSMGRSVTAVKRYILGNLSLTGGRDCFITLTFSRNLSSLSEANREFSRFIMRLSTFWGSIPRYLAVPQYQKRGAVHYHCVFFDLPSFFSYNSFREVWGQGSMVNVKDIDSRNVDDMIKYMVRYMTRDLTELPKGSKRYLVARHMKKPIKITDSVYVERLRQTLFKEVGFPREKIVFVSTLPEPVYICEWVLPCGYLPLRF